MGKDLFGITIAEPIDARTNKRTNQRAKDAHRKLLELYGESEGNRCKACDHCLRYSEGKVFYKCELTKITHSLSTDWRVNWQACGKFVPSP